MRRHPADLTRRQAATQMRLRHRWFCAHELPSECRFSIKLMKLPGATLVTICRIFLGIYLLLVFMFSFKQALLGFTAACLTFSASASITRLELDRFGPIDTSWGVQNSPWEYKYTEVVTPGSPDASFSMRHRLSRHNNSLDFRIVWTEETIIGPRLNHFGIEFSSPWDYVALVPGVYDDTDPYGYMQGRAGMTVGEYSMAYTYYDGSFEIFDLQRDSSGTIVSFAAAFEVHQMPAIGTPITAGRIWFDSSFGVSEVPEPHSVALVACALLGMCWRRPKTDHLEDEVPIQN
ncbi:PEP-CTERM sorting domain-containing protein [Pseudorhodoferax sp. Leaf265]|uniref:PEP-CTERM sorting domain-containing protein n=1 Tax=Pseudorhodoferax sp. Leaf265 TaxID=1736315 RepID=UPI00138EFEC7|nr:PEP-CTERM sorting domain-containing protein [Pseudorhodoferax sp. Leaf265]